MGERGLRVKEVGGGDKGVWLWRVTSDTCLNISPLILKKQGAEPTFLAEWKTVLRMWKQRAVFVSLVHRVWSFPGRPRFAQWDKDFQNICSARLESQKHKYFTRVEAVSKSWVVKRTGTESKQPHLAALSVNLSVEVRPGPLSDLNLQPVCWHAYNTCSYAWLRHIRLWNSTSSAGPLTICHFLTYFPSRLFLQDGYAAWDEVLSLLWTLFFCELVFVGVFCVCFLIFLVIPASFLTTAWENVLNPCIQL